MLVPRELLEDIVKGNCLPFVGAGFSKNADLPNGKKMSSWSELCNDLAKSLDATLSDNLEIAEAYEKKFGRKKLVQEIERVLLTNIAKAGEVHHEFAKIPDFKLVFTTNFDTLLEQAYRDIGIPAKSLTGPMQAVMLASPPAVNIIKMHGDIESPEYMVITKTDYGGYMEKYKIIVTQLSARLETMTPLFLGYSLSDPDFQQVHKTIEDTAKEFAPKGYIILLNPDEPTIKKFEAMNLNVIPLRSNTKTQADLMLEFLREISLYKSISDLPDDIDIKPKKSRVTFGGPLVIRTRVKPTSSTPITLKIYDPEGDMVYQTKISIGGLEQLTKLIVSGGKWKDDTHYQLVAEYNGKTSRSSVYVSKPLPIVLQTDKSVYLYGRRVIATVVNPNVISNIPINLEIFRPDGKLVYKNTIPIQEDGDGIYQESILIGGKDWIREPNTIYKMMSEHAGQTAECKFYLSHFGATIHLDQKVYTWTDRVYITIVAPEANVDPNAKDIIGEEGSGKISISTKNNRIPYKLEETGPNTGIFTGYVILTGDPSIKGLKGVDGNGTNPSGKVGGSGPTDGFIPCTNGDSITVTYEYAKGMRIQGSALIRWNIGTVKWLQASHSIGSVAEVQIIDPDMNLDPQSVDRFDVKVWSDSDQDGIMISVIEKGENTGIFHGMVNLVADSSGENRLKVKDGDKIHVQYVDRTLPTPYTTSNEIILRATSFIGEITHPLRRLSLTDPIIVDKNNRKPEQIKTGQKIFIGAKVTNMQQKAESFVFIVQIKDQSGTVMHLSYVPISILPKQSIKPLLYWETEYAGEFNIDIFAWESIDEPHALSNPLRFTLKVDSEDKNQKDKDRKNYGVSRPSLNHNVIICAGSSRPDNPQFFVPEIITVKKGDKITWINEDVVGHTVTSGKPSDSRTGISFDSSLIPPEKRFTQIFQTLGTFYYFCQVHPWKIGIINVE